MEVTPSPTSPKAKKMKDIEKLYNDKSFGEIHKPPFHNGRVFIIILAIVIGIFSGFFGGYFFYNYFSGENQSSNIPSVQISRGGDTQVVNEAADLVEALSPAIVGIYSKKETTVAKDPRTNLYNPWEQLSTGLIVTSDGWIAIPRWATPNLSELYVAVTANKEVYQIEKIMADAVIPIYFVKINAENLPVVEFVDREDNILGQDVFLMAKNGSDQPLLLSSSIVQQQHLALSNTTDYLESSDNYQRRTLIRDMVPAAYQGSVAVDSAGQVLGLLASDGWPNSELIPAYQIRRGLSSLLKNGEVIRSSLGVYYIDLGTVSNISTLYSQGKKQGALIFGDLEIDRPAIETNGAAEEAGLAKEDIVLNVNSISIDEMNTLTDLIQDSTAGSKVKLEILRGTETLTVEAELNALK